MLNLSHYEPFQHMTWNNICLRLLKASLTKEPSNTRTLSTIGYKRHANGGDAGMRETTSRTKRRRLFKQQAAGEDNQPDNHRGGKHTWQEVNATEARGETGFQNKTRNVWRGDKHVINTWLTSMMRNKYFNFAFCAIRSVSLPPKQTFSNGLAAHP